MKIQQKLSVLKGTVFLLIFINTNHKLLTKWYRYTYLEYRIYFICSCALNINIKMNYGITNIIFRGKSHEGWYNYSELLSLSQEVD